MQYPEFHIALLQAHPTVPQGVNDALVAEMTQNLHMILGGREATLQAAAEALADATPAQDGTPPLRPGRFIEAFHAAERATWMMHSRPVGASFGMTITPVAAHH